MLYKETEKYKNVNIFRTKVRRNEKHNDETIISQILQVIVFHYIYI